MTTANELSINIAANVASAEQNLRVIKRSLDDLNNSVSAITSPSEQLTATFKKISGSCDLLKTALYQVIGINIAAYLKNATSEIVGAALKMEQLNRQFEIFAGSSSLAAMVAPALRGG